VEGPAAVQWLNMDNMGIVVINEGEISEEELEQNFNEMWKVKWFWHIRTLSEKKVPGQISSQQKNQRPGGISLCQS
jgi:hypothetical protein